MNILKCILVWDADFVVFYTLDQDELHNTPLNVYKIFKMGLDPNL